MNSTVDASYREAASTLKPEAVSDYLAVSPWDLERRDNIKEIWQLTDARGQSVGRLMLPLATNYTDFADRFYDALLTLGRVNDWDADQLLEQILATRADLFFVRLDQPTTDGTISFRQAEATIESIYSMMRSAAEAASGSRTRARRRGRLPAAVENYLDDSVRLGHTKRGSFIFTVASRLNETITANPSLDEEIEAGIVTDMLSPRRVMETLASSLQAARNIAVHGTGSLSDYYFIDSGVLESLEEIARPEDLRSIELSFQWAKAVSPPDAGSEPIKLDHRDISSLSEFRQRMASRVEEPASVIDNQVTLVGPVVALTRSDGEEAEDEAGEVVIVADVGRGRVRQVRVPLSGQDHESAIQAYRSKATLTVSGNLIFSAQRWQLTGDIQVGPSFLA